jgi:hypothetical protein
MRNGLIGLVSALVLASTMAPAACTSSGGAVGTGGSSSSGGTGGGGTSGGSSVTNLSGTEALGVLTPAEATQLCSDAYAYFGHAISRAILCKWKGLAYSISSSAPTDSALQANCTGQETACLEANPDSPSCSDIPSTCTATVAEYSSCITDQAAAFTPTVSGLANCATVTRDDLAAVWNFRTGDPPTSCTSLSNKCPDLDFPSPFNQ